MELRPTSAGNGSSLTLAESKFLQKIFGDLEVPSLLKLRNRLSKTLFYGQRLVVVQVQRGGGMGVDF